MHKEQAGPHDHCAPMAESMVQSWTLSLPRMHFSLPPTSFFLIIWKMILIIH